MSPQCRISSAPHSLQPPPSDALELVDSSTAFLSLSMAQKDLPPKENTLFKSVVVRCHTQPVLSRAGPHAADCPRKRELSITRAKFEPWILSRGGDLGVVAFTRGGQPRATVTSHLDQSREAPRCPRPPAGSHPKPCRAKIPLLAPQHRPRSCLKSAKSTGRGRRIDYNCLFAEIL
jgi:hypothetical protein